MTTTAEWLLWSAPSTMAVSFHFQVGTRMVIVEMNFEKGENAEEKMEKFFRDEDIPEFVQNSLLSSLHSLFLEDLRNCDLDSLSVFQPDFLVKQAWIMSNKYKKHHLEWRPKKDTYNATPSISFSAAYQFLANSQGGPVQDTLKQLEVSYIRSIFELVERSEIALNNLRQRHSEEMEVASRSVSDPTKISMIVARHVEEVEKLEGKWSEEIQSAKQRQRREYHDFVLNFYDIESKRQLSEQNSNPVISVQGPNNNVTPSSNNSGSSTVGGNNNKEESTLSLRSSFSSIMSPSSSPLLQLTRKSSSIVSKSLFRRKAKATSTAVRSADVAIPTTLVSALSEARAKEIEETMMIKVSNQVSTSSSGYPISLLYSMRVTSSDIMDFCKNIKPADETEDSTPSLIASNGNVYGDSLQAMIMLVDPILSYRTKNNKEFLRLCNVTTDFHFPTIEEQLATVKQNVLTGGSLREGDFFITKHSNLGNTKVVFHLVVDPKQNTVASSISPASRLAQGLKNILSLCVQYDIEVVAFPFLLLEPQTLQEGSQISPESESFKGRSEVVLQILREFLTEKLTEDIKSFVLVLPQGKQSESLCKTTQTLIESHFTIVI